MTLFLYFTYYQYFIKPLDYIILISKKARLQFQIFWFFPRSGIWIELKLIPISNDAIILMYLQIYPPKTILAYKKPKVKVSLFVAIIAFSWNNFNYVVLFFGIVHGFKFRNLIFLDIWFVVYFLLQFWFDKVENKVLDLEIIRSIRWLLSLI